jgi:hypothetical protein
MPMIFDKSLPDAYDVWLVTAARKYIRCERRARAWAEEHPQIKWWPALASLRRRPVRAAGNDTQQEHDQHSAAHAGKPSFGRHPL